MIKKLRISSKLSNLSIVENAVDRITKDAGIKQENYGKILVSIMEAVNNAIIHGNKYDERKFVDIEIIIENKSLLVIVADQGRGFKYEEVPDPTEPDNIEKVNGRGVFLMSKLADEIKFNRKGNSVEMTFKNILS